NELFINNGDGTFREMAREFGLDFRGFSQQAAFFDYDLDGDLDCYLLNHSVHSPENYGPSELRERTDSLSGDRLLRNDDGRFVDV
ncbi:MAG: VCBS repeat-containing protein, partial [Saprospiraceae bacterium]|nr:VCBS repeat-containing protein [Saprospiraceae bacterium]